VAAPLIGADSSDCIGVTNATSAITTLLHSVPLKSKDALLVMSTSYPTIKTAVGRAATASGASVIELQMDREALLRPELIVDRVRTALKAAEGYVRAVVMDHVVSFPPVVLPIKEIAAICREVCITAHRQMS
jgi:selenocysteine lyase/cysteine desulfurase